MIVTWVLKTAVGTFVRMLVRRLFVTFIVFGIAVGVAAWSWSLLSPHVSAGVATVTAPFHSQLPTFDPTATSDSTATPPAPVALVVDTPAPSTAPVSAGAPAPAQPAATKTPMAPAVHPLATALPMPPTSAPRPVTTSSPVPVSSAHAWSSSTCSTMEYAMQWDAQLDTAAATGTLTTYYRNAAAQWTSTYWLIKTGPCSSPAYGLSGSSCTNPPAWFTTAIGTHVYDEQQHPADASWDNQWIGTYTNLKTLWSTITGCGGH